jgi:hypothetical protein
VRHVFLQNTHWRTYSHISTHTVIYTHACLPCAWRHLEWRAASVQIDTKVMYHVMRGVSGKGVLVLHEFRVVREYT